MKQNQGFSQKFNPNPFTGGKSKDNAENDTDDSDDKKMGGFDYSQFIPFGRSKRSLFGGDGKNPIEKNFEINKKFADKFGFSGLNGQSRKKRSVDPYDESTDPDDADLDDSDDDADLDDSDDDSSDDKKNDFAKDMDKKFSDYFGKMFGSKKKSKNSTDSTDDDDDTKSGPFGDLSKFVSSHFFSQLIKTNSIRFPLNQVKKRIDEDKKAKAKKEADKDATDDTKDDVNLKGAKPDDASDDDDDDDDKKNDFAKDMDKKFSDYFGKKFDSKKKSKKNSTDDDDDAKGGSFGDLSKFVSGFLWFLPKTFKGLKNKGLLTQLISVELGQKAYWRRQESEGQKGRKRRS